MLLNVLINKNYIEENYDGREEATYISIGRLRQIYSSFGNSENVESEGSKYNKEENARRQEQTIELEKSKGKVIVIGDIFNVKGGTNVKAIDGTMCYNPTWIT